jgi:hypothetical protein
VTNEKRGSTVHLDGTPIASSKDAKKKRHKAVLGKCGGNPLAGVRQQTFTVLGDEFPKIDVHRCWEEALSKHNGEVKTGRLIWWVANKEDLLRSC